MIIPRPNPRSNSQRPVRMAAVADFLATKQLSEFERELVARCINKQTAHNEDTLNLVAEPYYRGELEQLLEVLEQVNLDAQGHHEVRRTHEVGLGPFGSPKMHHGFLTTTCRRLRIALPPFESRRIGRPKPKIHENAGRCAPGIED